MKNITLYRLINNLKDITIKAGWFEDVKYPNGTPVGVVMHFLNNGGIINNPGSQPYLIDKKTGLAKFVSKSSPDASKLPKTKPHQIIIPARPFMENAVNNNKDKWDRKVEKLIKQYLKGNLEYSQIVEQLKLKFKCDIQQSIRDTTKPPSAPSTLRQRKYLSKKGGAHNSLRPLIDTGYALDNVEATGEIK